MIFRKCDRDIIDKALAAINKQYADNIRLEIRPATRGRGWNVRVRCASAYGPGARFTHSFKRIPFACWHVVGNLVDKVFELCPDARVQTKGKYYKKETWIWDDWNAGSKVEPAYMSEMCLCERS